jgi:hypothetical protein
VLLGRCCRLTDNRARTSSGFRDDTFAGHQSCRFRQGPSLNDRKRRLGFAPLWLKHRSETALLWFEKRASCSPFRLIANVGFRALLLKTFRSLQLRHLRRLLRGPVEFRASCGLDSSVCGARCLARLARLRVTAGALGCSCVARVSPTDAALKSLAPESASRGHSCSISVSFARGAFLI